MKSRLYILAGMLLAILAGCGGGSGSDSNADGGNNTGLEYCSADYKKNYVYTRMQALYLWYADIPDVDPLIYSDQYDVLENVRAPIDAIKHYSYITTQAEEQALLSNAGYVGFGFSAVTVTGNDYFFREVFPGGPAANAGFGRGDEVLQINDEDVATLIATGEINTVYGPAEVGHQVKFDIRPANGDPDYEITIAKAEVTIPTVSYVNLDADGGADNVGYLYFRSFVNVDPNTGLNEELEAAFADMKAAGITRLILDLRYNGGGLVSIAEQLGNLIGGATHAGAVYSDTRFNDKRPALNHVSTLRNETNSIPITDLVVITTGSTASSSELVINGLAPHINVYTVGDDSYGKPVGQEGDYYCEEVLRQVTFETLNANGNGRYFDGIGSLYLGDVQKFCPAVDDISMPLGEAGEASFDEALHVALNGDCSGGVPKAQQQLAQKRIYSGKYNPLIRDGWDVETGNIR